MDFREYVETLRNPPEDGVPTSIYDDLTKAWDDFSTGSEAKVSELQTRTKEYESEISRLKAKNYDLLMATAGDNGSDSENDNDEDNKSDSHGIDSLFGS
jgi:hypothetical protein